MRTFVADRMGYINDVVRQHLPCTGASELDEIVRYAIAAPAKRMRPALILMLAEGLGIDPRPIEPALAASELLHTASLLFDDLPAQDNATLRRGKPAAHLAFDEGTVQLAGSDAGRTNLIRSFGMAVARHVMDHHLMKAIGSCRQLPFDTRLLEAAVRHFATRVK